MSVIITGVPGVGKTSICRGLEKAGYKVVTFGDVMFEIARKYGIKSRDEMRKKLSVEKYKKVQEEAAKRIGEMGNVIVDTHCSILVHGGYYPGLPQHILLKMNPEAMIIIEADPEEVEKRRKKDAEIREREGNVREHQEMNRAFAAAYAAIAGIPVFFVRNEEGKLEEAIEQVKNILSRL